MRFTDVPTWKEWQKASSSAFQTRSTKPKLKVVDDLIKNYPLNSIPSPRPALIDLSNGIYDWADDKLERDADTGRLEAMQALDDVVQRKLQASKPGGYEEIVCIGYDLPTGEFDKSKQNPVDNRKGVVYSGISNDQLDMQGRAHELKKVIRTAYQLYECSLGRNNSIVLAYLGNHRTTSFEPIKRLKIFMAPEFYFRGKTGAYAIERLFDLLPMMREETKDGKYADWLFVLGSCVCFTVKHKDVPDHVKNPVRVKAFVETEEGVILENFAVIQKGGFANGDGAHDYYVEKEYVSHIDYDRPLTGKGSDYSSEKRVAMVGGSDRKAMAPPGSRDVGGKTKTLDEGGRGGCIFKMDGITFGLEVCLDHLKGRLKKATDNGDVKIQLIPSAGASIKPENCLPGVVVFNVDGGSSHHVVVQDRRRGTPVVSSSKRVGVPSNRTFFPGDGELVFYAPLSIP
jgi:hypothetical protein